jgi:hypothetical protein
MVRSATGGDGRIRVKRRVRRKKIDREAIVAEVMQPFERSINSNMPQPGPDGKVTTRMLLEALSDVQNSQLEFQHMVTESLETLAGKIASGGVGGDDGDDEEDCLASPNANGDEEDFTDDQSSSGSPGSIDSVADLTARGSKALKVHEDAMAISIKKMAKKMFSMLDTDEGNEIAIEDAVDFVRNSGNTNATPTVAAISAIYDTDGNGMIDLSEFEVIVSDIYKSKMKEAKVTNQALGDISDVFAFLDDATAEKEDEEEVSSLLPTHLSIDF